MSTARLTHWSIGRSRAAVGRFSNFAKKYPFAISSVFMGARYLIGDALVQQSNTTWDQRRSTTFFVFGIVSGYAWGRVINQMYPFLMRTLSLKNRLWMIALEGTINIPLIYFPMFYLTQDFIAYNSFSVSRAGWLYLKNFQADWVAWSKFWPATLFVSITLMPNHLIPVFSAVVGLIWVIILSKMRGELEDNSCVKPEEGVKFALQQIDKICSDDLSKPIMVD